MDFKSLISQLDQLSEATEKTKTGIKHTAEPGGYGRKDDEDEEGNKIKATSTEKKGRGRPKKATSTSGEDKKYDFSAFGVKTGKDVKLPKYDKKKTTKHSLKEYLDQLESALNEALTPAQKDEFDKKYPANIPFPGYKGKKITDEAEQIQIKPASQMPKKPGQPGQPAQPGQPQQVAGQPQKDTQVIAQGNKTLGTVNNPQLAQQIKQSIGKGEMTLMPDQEMAEGDIGKHNNATTGFDALVRKLTPKYGVGAAKRIAGSQMKKIKEADQPPHDSLASPLSMEESKMPMKKVNGKSVPTFAADGKGKNDLTKKKVEEDMDSASKTDKSKMPSMAHIKKMCKDGKSVAEICKMHPNCDQKELKQMVADCKKKMVKEGMNTRLKAARHTGKAHALGKQSYNCSYDDMEESRHYHEGYKEGLDECYGQMPIQGYVGETNPPATLPGMADQAMREPAMEDDMYEMDKTSYMKQQAIKTPGDTFKAFGQTFKDKEVLESPFAFEAWDKELNALLESKEDVAEGMTVSISNGQQGSPDSVSVSAQDGEADQLLSLIKSAGLGLFGGDDTGGYGAPQGQAQHGGVDVVGDHDGMMALIKKITGGEAGNGDYADEVGSEEHGEHGHEEGCNECGMAYESCGCDDKEMVDEVESEDQMTYQMAEDNPPDSGADNTDAEIADTQQANQAAAEYNPKNDVDEGAGGPEASEEPEEPIVSEAEDETGEEAGKEKMNEGKCKKCDCDPCKCDTVSESSFFSLYKKLAMLSEESTSEKDDKAEKAAKKVAKDIEYDEGHKGKDDDKAEKAGKEVKKDIEYDDKKDKKKIDEWANEAGPGKSASDTAFETDIDFMMNVISGGLNKRKSTGQTTIPVLASQLGRQVARKTTDINESVEYSSDAVAQWKKLAGLK
jgi:hypothetical protein